MPSDEAPFYHDVYPNDPANKKLKKPKMNAKITIDKERAENHKKENLAYKYSQKGQGCLHEAIILLGRPCFITWNLDYGLAKNENKKIVPLIEESTRIIRPPSLEEYPYTPYEFADEAELNDYFRRANTITLDELYQMAKGIFQKYVKQDNNIIVILTADSILTYFQDLFPIIHYSEGIGGNDAGKSSIGYTFEYTAYRVIRGTSISGANYYRILSNIEPGQCTIIEDEADNISEDPEKVKILKAGYEYKAKIPKTNMNTKNQEMNWFYPFCYKMLLGEKSLSEWKAKGLVDRTFSFRCSPGRVRYSIKKVTSETINKSPELQRLYSELLDFRKLMLCYRLIHYADELSQIEISVINRDEELSYPLLQLFYGTKAFEEIKTSVEFFLSQRKQRRSGSLEAALYPILQELINAAGSSSNLVHIKYSFIWNKITSEKRIQGTLSSQTQYDTLEYGPLYQNTLSKFISDKFSCDLRHEEDGSVLIFDKDKFECYREPYSHLSSKNGVKIDVKLMEPNTDGTDDTEGSPDGLYNFESENNSNNNKKEYIIAENNKANASTVPSEPSAPSFVLTKRRADFPPKCYRCEFSNYTTKGEYEYHCVTRHPGLPGYPGPTDIKESGLTPQGMSWEV